MFLGSTMLPQDESRKIENERLFTGDTGAWIKRLFSDINHDEVVGSEALGRINGVVDILVEVVKVWIQSVLPAIRGVLTTPPMG